MPNENDVLSLLATQINKRAKEKFKSNIEFAAACDVDETTIRRVLKGEQNISIKILEKICISLEINISDLFKTIGH